MKKKKNGFPFFNSKINNYTLPQTITVTEAKKHTGFIVLIFLQFYFSVDDVVVTVSFSDSIGVSVTVVVLLSLLLSGYLLCCSCYDVTVQGCRFRYTHMILF